MDDELIIPEGEHAAIALLLPWYATGRLEAEDAARTTAHLALCSACRAMLEEERALVAAARTDLEPVPAPDWAAVERRLDAAGVTMKPTGNMARHLRRGERGPARPVPSRQPLRWVIAAQFAALALVGGYAVMRPGQATESYHVLGAAPDRPQGNVLAMFRPDATELAIRRALLDIGARVVDGPTSGDAYVLTVAGGATPARLEALRSHSVVVMAEPISAPVNE